MVENPSNCPAIAQDNPDTEHSCHHCSRLVIDIETAFANEQQSLCRITSEHPNHICVDFGMSLQDLELAENEGCLLSKWLCYQFEDLNFSKRGASWRSEDRQTPFDKSDSLFLGAEVGLRNASDVYQISKFLLRSSEKKNEEHFHFQTHLAVYCVHDNPAAKFVSTRPINKDPDSESTYRLARAWLSSCISSRALAQNSEGCFMPTRLLRIDRKHDVFDLTIQHTDGLPYAPYAALSYCWGGDQPYKTTQCRIIQGNFAVSWSELPKSIRDGVKVTTELSLGFLWVDSICIVQDDPEDVLRELAQMARIYSQSTITIAASRAMAAHDGFLQPRQVNAESDISYNIPCLFRLPFRCPGGEIGSVCLASVKKTVTEPLDSRAWAFQERLLSPRILEYNSRQVRWICSHADCQNDHTDGWIPTNDDRNKENLLVSNETERPWTKLVCCYTSRQLTVQTDRALAIAGVAETFQSHHSGSYFVGLWESSFARDLIWTVSRKVPPPYVKLQGPSWSWTSINQPVVFKVRPAEETKIMMELIDCDIKLLSRSVPYGAVSEATVRIRGRLCLGAIPSRCVVPHIKLVDLTRNNGFPYTAEFSNDASYYDPSKTLNYQNSWQKNERLAQFLMRYHEMFSSDWVLVYLLEVSKWKLDAFEITHGLVLQEMRQRDTNSPKLLTRLGIFSIDNHGFDSSLASDKDKCMTELTRWFEDHGSEHEVIEIV